MQLAWAVVCESVVTDSQSNRVSLLNVIEEVSAYVDPNELDGGADGRIMLPLPCYLVALVCRSDDAEAESSDLRVRVGSVEFGDLGIGSQILRIDLSVFLRSRATIRLPGLPLPNGRDLGPGVINYQFVVEGRPEGAEDWVYLGSAPIRLALLDQPPAALLVEDAPAALPAE